MNSDDLKAKALRQYRHNDNSGFVFGYDIEVVDEYAASMQEEIDRLTNKCERLKQEAILHHGEDTAHKSTLFDIYHHIGAQKGDWNGSKPVIEYIQQLQAEVEALKAGRQWISFDDQMPCIKDNKAVLIFSLNGNVKYVNIWSWHGLDLKMLKSHGSHWMPLPEPPRE
jgi:hypothetical protein